MRSTTGRRASSPVVFRSRGTPHVAVGGGVVVECAREHSLGRQLRTWPSCCIDGFGHVHLSPRLSFTARCTGLSRYSITLRFPVLISAVTFIPGLKRMRLPSTSMLFFASVKV